MIHLTRYNLDVMNSGHSESFRRSLTKQAIEMYDRKMKDQELFRTKEEVQESGRLRPDKSPWFKKNDDCDVILNIPPTPDQELLTMIKQTVSGIQPERGTRVRPIQSFGSKIISQIMTRDVGKLKSCNRSDCLVCIHLDQKASVNLTIYVT